MKHPNRVCRDAKRFSFKARLQAMAKPDLPLGQFVSPWFRNQPKLPRKPNLTVFLVHGSVIQESSFAAAGFDITNEPVFCLIAAAAMLRVLGRPDAP
jgi:hypothetical protein